MQVRYQLRHGPVRTHQAYMAERGGLEPSECRDLNRDDRAVAPEAFERVIDALLLMEDVDHEVAEVQQNPTPLASALAAQPLGAMLEHALLDHIGDRFDLTLVAAGKNEECVREGQHAGNIEGDGVEGLLVVCDDRRLVGEIPRAC